MSLLVPINGQNYIIPETNEVGWGSNLDDFFVAISAGTLQKTGGSFTLSAETDFGASFGLKSLSYKSRSSNIAASGILRLANNSDAISWRNFLNNADLPLAVNASNQLTFNGTAIGGAGIFTASCAIVSDGSGNLAVATTTATEIGYVNGVTSAIQTQLDAKQTTTLTSGNILVGNVSNVATSLAMSGDITITNAGVTAIGAGKIVNAQVNASAAIAYSKLNLTGSIVNADVNASAAIAYSKLNLALSIVNADVSTSAAIAYSKLNLTGSIVNADVNAAAAIAYSKLALTGSIVNADISSSAAIAITKVAIGTANQVIGTNAGATANEFKTLTATANQVSVTHGVGTVTFATPQDIGTASAVRFGSLALGGALDASSILSLTSTTKGFLPPVMTTTQKNAISSPTDGLIVYDSSLAQLFLRAGAAWTPLSVGGGSGTVGSGTANQLAYYSASGTTVAGLTSITASRALASDANGLPVAQADGTTATELGYVHGVTSAIQTQINAKSPSASPTFTGTSIFSGDVSVTRSSTGTVLQTISNTNAANAAAHAELSMETDPAGGDPWIRFLTTGATAWSVGIDNSDSDHFKIQNSNGLATGTATGIDIAAAGSMIFNSNGATALTIDSSQISTFAGDTLISRTAAGSTVLLKVKNADQSNTASDAKLDILVGTSNGSTAGDAYVNLEVAGIGGWCLGLDNSDSDAFVLSSGNAVGTSNAIRVDPTSLAVAIHGSTTNDNATAGFVGETVLGNQTTYTNFPTSTQWGDLTSISLTAGDWLVWGTYQLLGNGGTTTEFSIAVTTTTGNSTTGFTNGLNNFSYRAASLTSTNEGQLTVSAVRFSLSSPATVYLKYEATWSTTAPQAAGNIRALRIR